MRAAAPFRLKTNANPFDSAFGLRLAQTQGMASHPFDSTQELRAAILASLPYPPLPVAVKRLEGDSTRLGVEVTQTSHDILSLLLRSACTQYTVSENRQRQLKQQDVLRGFLRDLVREGLQPYPDLYATYCRNTLRHVATYPAVGTAPDIRFMPHDSVCRGDRAHRQMCDYMAAQSRILETGSGYSAQDWQHREYADMLVITRSRLVIEEREHECN
jgi:hypothetical protein